MKTLHFVGPIRFEVLDVVVYPQICHLVGRFLTGKFRNERRLRAKLDERWHGTKNHIIELPGHELREVVSNWQPGRRAIVVPACAGHIYVMPLEVDAFKFNDVKVLAALKRSVQRTAPQGMSDGFDNSQELKDAIATFQAFKKECGF